jgi:hypothetical protein
VRFADPAPKRRVLRLGPITVSLRRKRKA